MTGPFSHTLDLLSYAVEAALADVTVAEAELNAARRERADAAEAARVAEIRAYTAEEEEKEAKGYLASARKVLAARTETLETERDAERRRLLGA